MPLSMTAWGSYKDHNYSINIRSLNSKYKEINLHLPQEFFSLEPAIYSFINKKIMRGKIDVFVDVEDKRDISIKINEKLFMDAYLKFKKIFNKKNIKTEVPVAALIQNIEGIIQQEADGDKKFLNWTKIKKSFSAAIKNLFLMKKVEGDRLAKDIKIKINEIEKEIKKISKAYIKFKNKYIKETRQKLKEILDEDKCLLNKEIVQILDKFDINEELIRLSSHIIQIKTLLKKNQAIGKKIDFLTQEINREANTVLSKVSYLEITKSIVNIKEANDKIREQIQNIE